MTIRENVNRRKKKLLSAFFIGIAIFFVGSFLGTKDKTLLWFAVIGFAIAIIAITASYLVIRCPKCNGNLGYVAMTSGHPFAISKKIHYCPYCGVNIDDKLSG